MFIPVGEVVIEDAAILLLKIVRASALVANMAHGRDPSDATFLKLGGMVVNPQAFLLCAVIFQKRNVIASLQLGLLNLHFWVVFREQEL